MAIENATGVIYGDTTAGSFYQEILNDMFMDRVIDARNNSNVLWTVLRSDVAEQHVEGRNIVFPIWTARSTGSNAIHAGGDLPDPGAQGFDQHRFKWRSAYARIKIGGIVKAASEKKIASWLTALDTEMRGIEDDFGRQCNRMLHNDGSGRIAEIASGTASATQTLQLNSGIVGTNYATMDPNNFIRVGKDYAIVTRGAGNTIIDVQPASSISGTNQVVFGASVTTNTGDWVVEFSSIDSQHSLAAHLDNSGFQAEAMGLEGIMSDQNIDDGNGLNGVATYNDGASSAATSFQGVAVSGNNWNQCYVNSAATARDLTLKLLQQTISQAEKRNNAHIKYGVCPFETYDGLIDLVYPDRRYNSMGDVTNAGHQGSISYNGVEFYKDRDSYPQRIKLIDPDYLAILMVADMHWMDEDGSILHRMDNKDSFQATMRMHYQLATWCRERVGAHLTDLTQ